ncbi:MAG TPA: hypothetical protein VKX17_05120 [Planctomycetota bacterium]|nr:hypothetical protein [Planctomycetota bacterium]
MDRDEEILERLEDLQDELEEIVAATGENDDENYLQDLRIRVRKAGGRFFLALTWYRAEAPSGSAIYPPNGSFLFKWYKTLDRDGFEVWVSALEIAKK